MQHTHPLFHRLSLLTLALLCIPLWVHALPSYTLTDLGPCVVRGMAHDGIAVVVGDCDNVAYVLYPYTRSLGVITQGGLGSRGEGTAWAYVVGESSAGTNGAPTHGFVWTAARGLVDLGTTGSSALSSFAQDVNTRGSIVGYGDHPTEARTIALLWCCGGGVYPLPEWSPGSSKAFSINEWGDVVGFSTTPSGVQHAVLWGRLGGMWDLQAGSANSGLALAINNWRQVVGLDRGQAVFWDPAAGSHGLPPLASDTQSFAMALNDWGTAVGFSLREDPMDPRASQVAAVLWAGETPIALTELVTHDPGWTLTTAVAINNAGMITGMGLKNGQHRGYLLTPTWRTMVRQSTAQVAQAETHGTVLRVLLPRGSAQWVQ